MLMETLSREIAELETANRIFDVFEVESTI
jgi:hypothetical protein